MLDQIKQWMSEKAWHRWLVAVVVLMALGLMTTALMQCGEEEAPPVEPAREIETLGDIP